MDYAKEFIDKLTKEEKEALGDIIKTPNKDLLKQVKIEDLKEKKTLVGLLELFKKIHTKKPTEKTKDIIISLIADLEEVNKRIDRITKWLAH